MFTFFSVVLLSLNHEKLVFETCQTKLECSNYLSGSCLVEKQVSEKKYLIILLEITFKIQLN